MTTQTDRINGLTGSVAVKVPCKVATTANITLSGEQTIDGVSVTSGMRVLVKDQTDTEDNGVYICDADVWARAKDFNGTRDIAQGTRVFAISGTAGGGLDYQITTEDPIIRTTAIEFSIVEYPATTSAFIATLLDDANQSEAQTTLGISTYIKTLIDDTSAAAARATLGVIDEAIYRGDAAGTADAITVSLSPTMASLTDGQVVFVRAFLANVTTTPTIDIDSLGAKTIVKRGSQALVPGDIARAGHELILKYNATNDEFELLNYNLSDVGDIVPWPKGTPKVGTLETDGSAIEIVDYQALYAVLGNDYGLGAGTTFTADTDDVITDVAHGLLNGHIIEVTNSGGALPAGLAADTTYYIINKTNDTFEVSLTEGGTAVDITGTGTGTHSWHNEIKIPDYRGEFLRGWDNAKGTDADASIRTDRGDGTTGDVVGSKQADAIRNITGVLNIAATRYDASSSSGVFAKTTGGNTAASATVQSSTFTFDASTVVATGSDNRPSNINVMYCINY